MNIYPISFGGGTVLIFAKCEEDALVPYQRLFYKEVSFAVFRKALDQAKEDPLQKESVCLCGPGISYRDLQKYATSVKFVEREASTTTEKAVKKILVQAIKKEVPERAEVMGVLVEEGPIKEGPAEEEWGLVMSPEFEASLIEEPAKPIIGNAMSLFE